MEQVWSSAESLWNSVKPLWSSAKTSLSPARVPNSSTRTQVSSVEQFWSSSEKTQGLKSKIRTPRIHFGAPRNHFGRTQNKFEAPRMHLRAPHGYKWDPWSKFGAPMRKFGPPRSKIAMFCPNALLLTPFCPVDPPFQNPNHYHGACWWSCWLKLMNLLIYIITIHHLNMIITQWIRWWLESIEFNWDTNLEFNKFKSTSWRWMNECCMNEQMNERLLRMLVKSNNDISLRRYLVLS